MIRSVIETARLRLLPLRSRDAGAFCKLYGDARTMRFIACPLSTARARAGFAATREAMRQTHELAFHTILAKRSGQTIGFCSIQPPQRRARRVEIGLMLSAAACGKGLGTECARALIDAAFETLPIDTVWVQYRPANAAAERLFGRLGFLPGAGSRPRAARRANRIAFMQRIAWSTTLTASRGKYHVEHDQFS